MGSLLLDSLEIQQFRAFRHLRIERLGRVNLIVGKNSVGKTAILEALRVYADRGKAATVWDILVDHDESQDIDSLSDRSGAKERAQDIRYLFFGREQIRDRSAAIQIGSIGAERERLSIVAQWLGSRKNGQGASLSAPMDSPDAQELQDVFLSLSSHVSGTGVTANYRLDSHSGRSMEIVGSWDYIRHIFVSSSGVNNQRIEKFWSQTALTSSEIHVLEAIRLVVPDIERLSIVSNRSEPTPIVKVAGADSPLPLRSLGEGLHRIFGIALALVNAQGGFLLVDEIESGLHYTALLGLWRLVLETARQLNVQVFATTHSWDCIEAFQQAAREDQREEGVLIRLGRKGGDIVATAFDEDELAIATRERIEVR